MLTRRKLLAAGGALLTAVSLPRDAVAEASALESALAGVLKGASRYRGRVKLDFPHGTDNGFSVYTSVSVDSPMTPDDHIRAIHVLAEKNPLPQIASFYFAPGGVQARAVTNIRLAASQRIVALAETSRGQFFFDEKSVIVSIAGCGAGG